MPTDPALRLPGHSLVRGPHICDPLMVPPVGSVLLWPERVSGPCGRRTLSNTASEPHGVT